MAEQAIEQYQHVLDMNAARDQKVDSAKGIAYLYLNMKKFDQAKKYYRMAVISIPTIPNRPTRWALSIRRPATSPAWKSAPNSA